MSALAGGLLALRSHQKEIRMKGHFTWAAWNESGDASVKRARWLARQTGRVHAWEVEGWLISVKCLSRREPDFDGGNARRI